MIINYLISSLLVLFTYRADHPYCDCRELVAKKDSKVVFKGQVISLRSTENSSVYEVEFSVMKRLKGKFTSNKITTYTPCLSDMCCGIPFKIGEYYMVVTREINGKLYSDYCTTTQRIRSD